MFYITSNRNPYSEVCAWQLSAVKNDAVVRPYTYHRNQTKDKFLVRFSRRSKKSIYSMRLQLHAGRIVQTWKYAVADAR